MTLQSNVFVGADLPIFRQLNLAAGASAIIINTLGQGFAGSPPGPSFLFS